MSSQIALNRSEFVALACERQVGPINQPYVLSLEGTVTVEAVREEGGKWYVDLVVSTKNQNGVEVVKGNATALIDA